MDYEKQATDFLKETETEFKAVFIKNGLYSPFNDEEPRDIYKITLKKGERIYKFRFGQSINNSNGKTKPTPYEVLASLTSYNPNTFRDFCLSFGYNEDSRIAEKIYKAVLKEWANIQILYNNKEIEKLQEIN
jgi:hypothetical protein|tara:strand:- start:1045 stop:1440 length:396 start_codon:yes stop_codon:yes gene_type:complete